MSTSNHVLYALPGTLAHHVPHPYIGGHTACGRATPDRWPALHHDHVHLQVEDVMGDSRACAMCSVSLLHPEVLAAEHDAAMGRAHTEETTR